MGGARGKGTSMRETTPEAPGGHLLIGCPGQNGKVNEPFLRELRLRLLREELPPEADFDALVQVVELAEVGLGVEYETEQLREDLTEANEQIEELRDEVRALETSNKELHEELRQHDTTRSSTT